jgi:hypothetical protein
MERPTESKNDWKAVTTGKARTITEWSMRQYIDKEIHILKA